jgi:hypothetical protein
VIDYGTGVSEPSSTFGVAAVERDDIWIRRILKVLQVIYYKGLLETVVVVFPVGGDTRKKEFERIGDANTESFGGPRSFLFSDHFFKLLRGSACKIYAPMARLGAIEKEGHMPSTQCHPAVSVLWKKMNQFDEEKFRFGTSTTHLSRDEY